MTTSTRETRALQVWTHHEQDAPGDPGAVVIYGAHESGAGRPAGRLAPDEEAAVLAVDVHGQSCLQVAALLHVSVDGLAKIRRRAYAKIADDMQG